MKKIYIILLAFTGMFICYSFIITGNKKDGGIDMPNWQWTSGEVIMNDTAFDKAFNIKVNFPGCKPGDMIQVTFSSIKVTLGGLSEGTTCNKWLVRMGFLWKENNKWVPITTDSSDWINEPFMNRNSNFSDSLTNYSIMTKLPEDGQFTITVTPRSNNFNFISGNGKPIFAHGNLSVTTVIRGLKVQKMY